MHNAFIYTHIVYNMCMICGLLSNVCLLGIVSVCLLHTNQKRKNAKRHMGFWCVPARRVAEMLFRGAAEWAESV